MKKNFFIALALTVLATTGCTAKLSTTTTEQFDSYTTCSNSKDDTVQDTYFVVSGQEVNVRYMPSTDSEIADVYYRYTVIYGHLTQDGNWCEITLPDRNTRYISSDFITPISAKEAEEYEGFAISKKIQLYGIVDEFAYCYYDPTFSSDIMEVLQSDDIVTVSAILKNGWYLCQCSDFKCYIPQNSFSNFTNGEYEEYIKPCTTANEHESEPEPKTEPGLKPLAETKTEPETSNQAFIKQKRLIEQKDEYESEEIDVNENDDTEITVENNYESDTETKTETLLLGTFTTDYSFSGYNRRYNLEKAASTMNGIVINSNENFNWCRDMGPCGYDEGYLESLEIQDGQYVTGYGGGICQVSCTLCGAVLSSDGDFELVERYHHGIEQFYISREYDATVSYPDCNFVFKNNNTFSIMIETYFDGCYLTINICKVAE